jgi:MFS family permease
LGGWLSDRYGRKPVMIWPRIALLLATWPLFVLLADHRNALWLFGATAIITALNCASAAPAFTSLIEALPKQIRSGAFGIIYAFAISIFGGTTQLIETWLIHATGNVLAPAWYFMAATLIGIVAMMFMRETAPVRAAR